MYTEPVGDGKTTRDMQIQSMVEIGSALDPGRRKLNGPNQDSIGVVRPIASLSRAPLLVIADGMGGYAGGAVASRLVVECFSRVYLHSAENADPLQILQTAAQASLQALKDKAGQDDRLARMGSTVVAAIVAEDAVHLLNIGDSRAYLVNRQSIRQISYDHSLVGEQLRRGLITEAQVRVHPRRNVLSASLHAQRTSIDSFVGVFPWQSDDLLVLCSDGLWGPVTEPLMRTAVLQHPPQQAAERLVSLANANFGQDNISVIVAKLS